MKVLIWVLTFFVLNIVTNAFLKKTGIILSPVLTFFISMILCEIYDNIHYDRLARKREQ